MFIKLTAVSRSAEHVPVWINVNDINQFGEYVSRLRYERAYVLVNGRRNVVTETCEEVEARVREALAHG